VKYALTLLLLLLASGDGFTQPLHISFRDFGQAVPHYLPTLLVVTLLAFLAGVYGERIRAKRAWQKRRKWRYWNRGRQAPGSSKRWDTPDRSKRSDAPVTDPADQLRIVMNATFEKRPLLSRSEAQVLYAAEDAIRDGELNWRVMAQVSLGEVLSSPDPRAYSTINSKRVDLLIISSRGDPIAAIEYQGDGHYQGTAPARDAVKKEALRRAGVRYIEVTPQHSAADLAREISRLALLEPPPSDGRVLVGPWGGRGSSQSP
jgi:hypothetical protein